MGRPGYTEQVQEGMVKAGVDPDRGYFILGPELPDISSTAVREALVTGDRKALEDLLHPKVAEWCIEHGAFASSSVPAEVVHPLYIDAERDAFGLLDITCSNLGGENLVQFAGLSPDDDLSSLIKMIHAQVPP